MVLVAVGELDVGVLQREGLLGELLETNDDVVGRRRGPGAGRDKMSACRFVFRGGEDGKGRVFDIDGEAGVEEGFGRCGGHWGWD